MIVSKQSLNALANTTLTTMRIGVASQTPKVEYALHEVGAGGAFREFLISRFSVGGDDRFLSGAAEGFALGLAAAAIVMTNPLDLAAQCDALEAEIAAESQHWGPEFQPNEAA
jgi:predicted alpha/beta-fold hydrolase